MDRLSLFSPSRFGIFIGAFLSMIPHACGQKELGPVEIFQERVIEFLGNDHFNLTSTNSFRFKNPISQLSILEYEEICMKCNLTSEQVQGCRRILENGTSIRIEARDKIISLTDSKSLEEFAANYSSKFATLEKEVGQILSDRQLEQLKQLNNQSRLKKIGIVAGLQELLNGKGLDFTNDDERRLVNLCKNQKKLLSDFCESKFKKFDKEVFEPFLSKKENENLRFLWNGDNPIFTLDWVRAQANVKPSDLLLITGDLSSIFRQQSLFCIANNGSFKFRKLSESVRAGNFEQSAVMEYVLNQIASGKSLSHNKVNSSQLDLIDSSLQQIRAKRLDMEMYLSNSQNIWLDYENVIDMQNALAQEIETSLREILSKKQFDDLLVEASMGFVSRVGLAAIAKNDLLAKRLNLKSDQLREFQELLLEASSDVAKASNEMFSSIYKEVIGSIHDKACLEVIDHPLGELFEFGESSFLLMDADLAILSK